MKWNLWRWVKDRWHVVASFTSEKDAQAAIPGPVLFAGVTTIARQHTPKDQYMRDNATVRSAPQNYLRLPPTPPGPSAESESFDKLDGRELPS
jgi:hypothetical protein